MVGDRNGKLILGAFLQAANCSNYAGSWRHPASDPGFLTAEYYQEIARTLEAGKFHFGFIDDRLAMPSRYADSVEETVRRGIRAVKLDLIPVVMAMALATRHLGISATYSTTYHAPFHIARALLYHRPSHGRTRRVECSYLAQRLRSSELRPSMSIWDTIPGTIRRMR